MSKYISIKVNISEGQKEKIKHAAQAGTAVSIRLSREDLQGEHVLALTQAQVKKMEKAFEGGKGVTIKMSKTQLEFNRKVEGGFLQMLFPLLATAGRFLASNVLPALATGVLSSVGTAAGGKVIDKISERGSACGSGVAYLKKNGISCKVFPAGQGLFLAPWNKGNSMSGSGLFMKTGSGYVDGRGLLLGPNSPFQNIPILGLIL